MSTKKKIILTVLLGVLVGIGVYLIGFSLRAIIFIIIQKINGTLIGGTLDLITFLLTFIFVIISLFFVINIIYKLWKNFFNINSISKQEKKKKRIESKIKKLSEKI